MIVINKGAIILAGGKSSRMNYNDKAFLKLKETTMIQKILDDTLEFGQQIIISNELEKYKEFRIDTYKDILESKGPLAGIHVGLLNSKYDFNLVVACDMPNLNKEFLNFLGNIKTEKDAIVPKIGDHVQPLCSVYKRNIIEVIEKCIENNIYRVQSLYEYISVEYVEVPKEYEDIFININTPGQYKQFVKGD